MQLAALELSGPKKQSISGWLRQALVFYSNVLQDTEAQTALAYFNITVEALTAGKAAVEAVGALNTVQEKEKSEARQATQNRDEALDALDSWLHKFYEVAKLALADTPQQLVALQL